ncbi:MAG: hypothetical protein JWO08_2364 [Verrucomicrobiaceae bacterium]|nr:hypothetical protein [Verrucomicrobiaceae bacterium]
MDAITFKVRCGTGEWWDLSKCPLFPKGHRVEEARGRTGSYGLQRLLTDVHEAAKRAAYTLELTIGGTTLVYHSPALPEPLCPGGLQDMTTNWGRVERELEG